MRKYYIDIDIAEEYLMEGYSLDDVPVADVEPVRHGHWIESVIGYVDCSECGAVSDWESPYCPRCGAKMDGKENEK